MKPFTGPGSTPSRRRFWDQVTQAVNASRKIAGRHVTVSEHEGKGTLINVDDTSARRPSGGGGCGTVCPGPEATLSVAFSGIGSCGCTDTTGVHSMSLISTTDLNDSFSLPSSGAGEWANTFGPMLVNRFDDPTGCSGDEDQVNLNFDIHVTCDATLGWFVEIHVDGAFGIGTTLAFSGTDCSQVVSNTSACGFGVCASGGAAVISF